MERLFQVSWMEIRKDSESYGEGFGTAKRAGLFMQTQIISV